MEQHEFLVAIWNDPERIDNLSAQELSKHFYLFNRTFARKFPIQANQVNKNGINTGHIVKYWIATLRRLYKNIPDFINTNIYQAKKKSLFTQKQCEEYCKLHKCTVRDFMQLMEFFPSQMQEELKEFEDTSIKKKQKKNKKLNEYNEV